MSRNLIILLDVGNTRIKLGWLERQSGRRETNFLALGHDELDQVPAWLKTLPGQPATAIGVNVAGPFIASALKELLRQHAGCPLSWVSSQPKAVGLRNGYDEPAQLGADRWLSMIGLAQRAKERKFAANVASGTPLMLASFGTATTIDTLGPQGPTEERTFQGGLILPGPALMRSSLASGTANLPDANGTTAAYPAHTHQAIVTGIAAAQAGAVLRQWREGLARYECAPRVFSSGGGWRGVADETQRLLARAQDDLGLPRQAIECLFSPVLDGLACLACQSAH